MATPNEDIADGIIRRQVYLSRYAGGLGNEIVRLLDMTERDLARQIKRRADEIADAGKDRGPATTKRLKALYDDVAATRATAFKAISAKMNEDMGGLATIEAGALKKLVEGVSPIELNLELPRTRQLASILGSLFGGDTMRGWLSRMEDADFNRIKDQIAVGFLNGETVEQITARIIGTAQLDGKDGVTQITRNGARTLARTATNHVANSARQTLYSANSDIFTEEMFVATLDSRTSPICRSNDGKRFATGTGPIPPLHPNCRSTRVPVIGEFLGDRASQFGPVPAAQTYNEWLAKQTAAFQDDVLGPERGKLFRLGGLSVDRFNDASGRLYTLDQLKVREPSPPQRRSARTTRPWCRRRRRRRPRPLRRRCRPRSARRSRRPVRRRRRLRTRRTMRRRTSCARRNS
jgi:SPP1 gp7 family putative phage head morphogenesis protein